VSLDRSGPQPVLAEIALEHRTRTLGEGLELGNHAARARIVDLVEDAGDAGVRLDGSVDARQHDIDLDPRAKWKRLVELEAHAAERDLVDMPFRRLGRLRSPCGDRAHRDGAVHRVDGKARMLSAIVRSRHDSVLIGSERSIH